MPELPCILGKRSSPPWTMSLVVLQHTVTNFRDSARDKCPQDGEHELQRALNSVEGLCLPGCSVCPMVDSCWPVGETRESSILMTIYKDPGAWSPSPWEFPRFLVREAPEHCSRFVAFPLCTSNGGVGTDVVLGYLWNGKHPLLLSSPQP